MRRWAYVALLLLGVLLVVGGVATAAHGPAAGVVGIPVGLVVILAQRRNLREAEPWR